MTHEEIIKRIFGARDQKHLSNYALAKKSGLHESTIARIEQGAEAKLSSILLLAEALEMTFFIRDTGKNREVIE